MTERELEARLIHEQIPLPNGFDARQEAALCRAMAQTRGVAHRPKRTLLLAAALMLLTGAAFAAGGRGLAFFWRQATGVPSVMGTPCGGLPVSGWGVWPGVSMCGGTCVPGAVGSPGGRMTGASGSLPSGGLQREQLFSGAEEAPGCSSIS